LARPLQNKVKAKHIVATIGESVKSITPFIFILILVLAACSSPTPESKILSSPTNTVISTQSQTSVPPTATLELTATATDTSTPATPDYMRAYRETGFDNTTDSEKFYFVYNETEVHYTSGNGIVFNDRIIRSWVDVDYFENGVYKRGVILGYVLREMKNIHNYFGKYTVSSSGALTGMNPSLAFIQGNDKFFAGLTPDTDYPIMVATFKISPTGDAELYEAIFPVVDGKTQSVNIPSIGEVLPITDAQLVNGK
jgi:hypothetical protein